MKGFLKWLLLAAMAVGMAGVAPADDLEECVLVPIIDPNTLEQTWWLECDEDIIFQWTQGISTNAYCNQVDIKRGAEDECSATCSEEQGRKIIVHLWQGVVNSANGKDFEFVCECYQDNYQFRCTRNETRHPLPCYVNCIPGCDGYPNCEYITPCDEFCGPSCPGWPYCVNCDCTPAQCCSGCPDYDNGCQVGPPGCNCLWPDCCTGCGPGCQPPM